MIAAGPMWLLFLLRFIEITALLVVTIFWIRSMQRTLRACHPAARASDPDSAWLVMIPLFGLVWQFIANAGVSESIAREYRRRGWHLDEMRPAFEQGIIACLVVSGVVLIRTSFALNYEFDFVSTLVIGNLHPGFGFVGTVIIGFCMYRHMDRLAAFRERMEKEPDPTLYTQPMFAFQQPNNYPPPSYPQQPSYPPQSSFPPNYTPPGYAPVPVYTPPPAPDVPKEEPKPVDDYDRWRPKDPPQS